MKPDRQYHDSFYHFESFQRLLARLKLDLLEEELHFVCRAFEYGCRMHEGQLRLSGEPYVTHPIAVADILVDWRLDYQVIAAALLHDVIEDTHATIEDVRYHFDETVAQLVDGVSKIAKIQLQSAETKQAENFRKIFLAMTRDIRVIFIKLADRLHNMRTLSVLPLSKRWLIAQETMDIYAPLAYRLGLHDVFKELEDLSFSYLHPLRFRVLKKAVATVRSYHNEVVSSMLHNIRVCVHKVGIEAVVVGQEKHLYSMYRKMLSAHVPFSSMYNFVTLRILLHTVSDCYVSLGAVHAIYKPVPGKFKDYVAVPKSNGYRSLHSTVFGPLGMLIEVQLCTKHMDYIAEAGVTAYWRYKEFFPPASNWKAAMHDWIQSVLNVQYSSQGDALAFFESVKIDLLVDEVNVFTPQGDHHLFPRGATVLDFSYAVHTETGHRSIGVRINGKPALLRTVLKNGDCIEMLLGMELKPKRAWLHMVKTGRARTAILQYLGSIRFDQSVALGKQLLAHALDSSGRSLSEISDVVWKRFLQHQSNMCRPEQLFSDIGFGRRLVSETARQLLSFRDPEVLVTLEKKVATPLLLSGMDELAVECASCCLPIPGDEVVGAVTPNSGLVIHATHCCVLRNLDRTCTTLVDIEWNNVLGRFLFPVGISVLVQNERGILSHICLSIAREESDIEHVSMQGGTTALVTISFCVRVCDCIHLSRIMRVLRCQKGVLKITKINKDCFDHH